MTFGPLNKRYGVGVKIGIGQVGAPYKGLGKGLNGGFSKGFLDEDDQGQPGEGGPKEEPFWKHLLLATAPAFIAGVAPIIVNHLLHSSGGNEPPVTSRVPVPPTTPPKTQEPTGDPEPSSAKSVLKSTSGGSKSK